VGPKHCETALKLNPDAAIARIGYANRLVMREGKTARSRAEEPCEEAAAREPLDATEELDVALARAERDD